MPTDAPFVCSLTPYKGREFEKACIHEAGHTVAARMNGFAVPWVSVDPCFIANDRIAIANECANSRALCMAMPTLAIGPILQKGRMESKQDRMHITNYVVEVMAGPYAEFHFSPADFNDCFRIADEKQARAAVAAVHNCPKLAKIFFNDANRLVPKFVKQNFETITRLANELGKRGTLHQDEIDAIIDPVVMAA